MKKALTFISTVSALISIQPVFAVDYVACREMLRTKNELIVYAEQAEGCLITYTIKNPTQDICADMGREARGQKIYRKIGYKTFYTKAGYKWFVSSGKVSRDMVRAGCPYE